MIVQAQMLQLMALPQVHPQTEQHLVHLTPQQAKQSQLPQAQMALPQAHPQTEQNLVHLMHPQMAQSQRSQRSQ